MFKVYKKTIISGIIGNALEMYDYMIWSLFSVFLANAFLPTHSTLSDIFCIFLITYLFRPIGGLISGILADQIGRKAVLTLSIFVMGLCTSAVGILPSYESAGIVVTVSLAFIRFLQVFSIGGEYISSIALLIESCDKNKKGYYGSWAAFGVNLGTMVASGIAAMMTYLMNHSFIPSWGWRLAFIVSLLTAVLGFWVRQSIPESYEFIIEHARKDKRTFSNIFNEMVELLKIRWIEGSLIFLLVLFGVSITFLIYVFSPLNMTLINHLSSTHAFMFNFMSLGLIVALIPFFGKMSDNYGRIPVLSYGIIGLVFIIVPYFFNVLLGSYYQVLCFHLLIAIPCACVFSIVPVLITELFPVTIRCSVTGFLYSIAAAIGGGMIPIVALKLIKRPFGLYLLSTMIIVLGILCLLQLKALVLRKENIKNFKLVNENKGAS